MLIGMEMTMWKLMMSSCSRKCEPYRTGIIPPRLTGSRAARGEADPECLLISLPAKVSGIHRFDCRQRRPRCWTDPSLPTPVLPDQAVLRHRVVRVLIEFSSSDPCNGGIPYLSVFFCWHPVFFPCWRLRLRSMGKYG